MGKAVNNLITNKKSVQEIVEREVDLQKNLIAIKAELEAEQKKAAALTETLETLEAEIERTKAKQRYVEKECRHYEKQYNNIKNSRSWKLLESVRRWKDKWKQAEARVTEQEQLPGTEKSAMSKPKDPLSVFVKMEKQPEAQKTQQQKVKLRKWADQKIERARCRMLNLGFTETGYQELASMIKEESKPYLRRNAAWELALWHANQYTKADAEKCLELLPIVVHKEMDPRRLRRVAIIEIERLQLLGEITTAKQIVEKELLKKPTSDLCLAAANLEADLAKRINWVNQALLLHDITPIALETSLHERAYDCLVPEKTAVAKYQTEQSAKVTVIMPVYNAENTIQTALRSVLAQTWRNLEVLVVDDCSTDHTAALVEEAAGKDDRVRLIKAAENDGAYVARNLALQAATGDFVTCNDADDWSHPQKIETQVRHLIDHPSVVANTSEQVLATEDLTFSRRGNPGFYTLHHMSSLLFRREKVIQAIGYWDSVRFAADSEFIRRIKKVFGEEACVNVPTGPLTFRRESASSPIIDSAFDYREVSIGVRQEYVEAQLYYHQTAETLYYDFPQTARPFQVPEPMWLKREEKMGGRRHFDIIIASDFRLDDGSHIANLEEIKAHQAFGLKTGLMQMACYDYDPKKNIHPNIRELLDGNSVQMVCYGEKVSCDILILRYPPILQEKQYYLPDVAANHIQVIANQTPMGDDKLRYNIRKAAETIQELFGKQATWYPAGPFVRESLHRHHQQDLSAIELADEDWPGIIQVEEWQRGAILLQNETVRIGRHSRDDWTKWPENKETLLAIYPADPAYEIHVLGGAEAPEKVLGGLPDNWHVTPSGGRAPKDFLQALDLFVYYTHPDFVKSCDRVILEAIAVGVPVILPPECEALFGEGAIYAEPYEVKVTIDWLMGDVTAYEAQVKRARRFVNQHFGYTKYAGRLSGLTNNKELASYANSQALQL